MSFDILNNLLADYVKANYDSSMHLKKIKYKKIFGNQE